MDFKRNFELEGFQNGSLSKWKEVKRRDPSSLWYGFLYKGENRKKVPRTTEARSRCLESVRSGCPHDLSWARARGVRL